MKKNRFFSFRFGKDRGGFTLTEVLLAVMIVGPDSRGPGGADARRRARIRRGPQ